MGVYALTLAVLMMLEPGFMWSSDICNGGTQRLTWNAVQPCHNGIRALAQAPLK